MHSRFKIKRSASLSGCQHLIHRQTTTKRSNNDMKALDFGSSMATNSKLGRNSLTLSSGFMASQVLTSLIIHHLEQDSPPGSVLLYFFFDFGDRRKQDIDNIIRSLICQLYQQEQCVRQDLDNMFLACQDGSQQPALESLKDVLNSMLGKTENITIVLDALDESCTRRDLLAWIRSILTLKPTTIRLLVTSRREQDIESTLETLMDSNFMVDIQNGLVDGDIRSYVRAYVQRSDGFARWLDDQSILEMIETTLSQKAHGM
jgi:hypothetical protein